MLKVDGAIYDTNRVICRNISVFDASDRDLLSQNILAQLRNFVEYIVQKVYSNGVDTDHITPWFKGGKPTPDNCQMLCRDCNLKRVHSSRLQNKQYCFRMRNYKRKADLL